MSKETVKNLIKSCIVSRKGGVPLGEIDNDYKDLVGQNIPYVALGYRNLHDFINSIDFVRIETNYLGVSLLSVSDPKVAHIDSLVSKQKNSANNYAGSNRKKKRKKRYAKNRQDKKLLTENRNTSCNRWENQNTHDYRSERFKNNARLEYTRSKWHSDRGSDKDSWRKTKNENRALKRFDNFNAGRSTMQNCSNTTLQSDHSWSEKNISSKIRDENMYNFHSNDERRYAQESRSWKSTNSSSNNESRYATHNSQRSNSYVPSQQGGNSANNYNYYWQGRCENKYRFHWAPRDNQSGNWWPGLQGAANWQFSWPGMRYPRTYHPNYYYYYPWDNRNSSQSSVY